MMLDSLGDVFVWWAIAGLILYKLRAGRTG